jgi:hypothetical protein
MCAARCVAHTFGILVLLVHYAPPKVFARAEAWSIQRVAFAQYPASAMPCSHRCLALEQPARIAVDIRAQD